MTNITKAIITLDVYIDISDLIDSITQTREALKRLEIVLDQDLIHDFEIKSVVIKKEEV